MPKRKVVMLLEKRFGPLVSWRDSDELVEAPHLTSTIGPAQFPFRDGKLDGVALFYGNPKWRLAHFQGIYGGFKAKYANIYGAGKAIDLPDDEEGMHSNAVRWVGNKTSLTLFTIHIEQNGSIRYVELRFAHLAAPE
jgi:hypothetical protein